MLFSGIQQFTLLDYPDHTACIVFTPGCEFRCGYCHNPEFVLPDRLAELRSAFIPEAAINSFLDDRRGLLDGVVITGGEPTLQPDLLKFMGKIKAKGFKVKLDTNGNRPKVIAEAIKQGLVDYIALDVKTSLSEYQKLAGPLVKPENVGESIKLIRDSGIDYEFRSTLIKEVHTEQTLALMVELMRGAKRLFLQQFRPGITLAEAFTKYHPFSLNELDNLVKLFKTAVTEVNIRAA